ncbi:hypothetical protein GQ473_02695, partial [archaeon]|nr:hypothetical protein [archaeon]
MIRRQYIFVVVAFLMMFVTVEMVSAEYMNFEMLTSTESVGTYDHKTDAMHEEMFDAIITITLPYTCNSINGCLKTIILYVAPYDVDFKKYNITNTSTINCSANGENIDSIIQTIDLNENNQVTKINCSITISRYGYLSNSIIKFNATTEFVDSDNNFEWKLNYSYESNTQIKESQTSILAPDLWIQKIQKNPNYDEPYTDYQYMNTNFSWDVDAANNPYGYTGYTGKAFGVYSNMTYNDSAFTPVNCNPQNISHGDIESGHTNISSCMFSADALGNYHFFETNLLDWSGYYNFMDWQELNIVNLTVNGSAEDMAYGDSPDIQATVKGIASNLESVNVSWNYTRINEDTGELEIASSSCIMNSWDYGVEKDYKCHPTINASGRYNVTFNVLDEYGEYDITATNTTTFDVAFGIANITNIMYNYDEPTALILKNQTFNISAWIDIIYGDVWGLNISIESSNPEIINVSNIANQTYILGNMQSWDYTNVTWYDVYVNNSGLVKLTIKITALNGTGVTYDKYPQIVDLIVDVKNNTLNIEDNQKGQVKFAGNFSDTEFLNLTIKNEFGLLYNNTLDDFYSVDAEQCYKLEGESHNVALLSNGAQASSGGGLFTYDPNASIDDNPTSNWYGITTTTGSTELNITFNETQSLQGIELLWNDNNGNANVSAYYYYGDCSKETQIPEQSCTLVKEDININFNPPNTTNTTIFEKIRAGVTKIQIIQHANNSLLNIYSLEAYTTPVTDYVPPCMIFNFTYNVPRSGIYQITPEITLEDSIAKRTNANNFFVYYGMPQILFGENIMILGEQIFTPYIEAVGGDLRNITINLTFSNTSVINLSIGENASKNISYIEHNNELGTSWNVNVTNENFVNITIEINSSITDVYTNQTEQ